MKSLTLSISSVAYEKFISVFLLGFCISRGSPVAVTPTDFTDHILIRLGITKLISEIQLDELKLRIETVLALAVTEYTFSYLNPSLLAASAIHLVLSRFLKIEHHQTDQRLCNAINAIPVSKIHILD